MLGNRSRPRMALATPWPNNVRSGVLNVISLAHFSPTFTRSWPANGLNAGIRLKAEDDRLRQELALLKEEMGQGHAGASHSGSAQAALPVYRTAGHAGAAGCQGVVHGADREMATGRHGYLRVVDGPTG